MGSTKKRRSRTGQSPSGSSASKFSVYDGADTQYAGFQFKNALLLEGDRPSDSVFKRCRYWRRSNWIIGTILRLKAQYYGFAFQVRPVRKIAAKKKKQFNDWWLTNRGMIEECERAAWRDWVLTQNLISFWRKDDAGTLGELRGRPVLLKPEEIKYHDSMGEERVELLKRPSSEELKLLPPELAERFQGGDRIIIGHRKDTRTGRYVPDPGLGEYFKVTKASNLGDGLAWPSLYSVFTAATQIESMDVGEHLWAYLSRTIYRQWKKGHEQRYQWDTAQAHWTAAWDKQFMKAMTNRIGLTEFTSNWDVELGFPFPDQKYFNPQKYDTVIKRIMWWGGPVAFMLVARGITPYLVDMLKAEAFSERSVMRGHLMELLLSAFNCPLKEDEVEVCWSNRCFKDARLLFEILKLGMQQGATSLATYNEEAGLDPVQERERKAEEGKAPDDEVLPRHDRSGHIRDATRGNPGGRPAGSPDPQ